MSLTPVPGVVDQEKKTIPTFCIGAPGQTNSSIVYSFIIYISLSSFLCACILCRDRKFLSYLLLASSIKFVKFKTAKCNTRLAEPCKSSILFYTNFCRKHFSIKNSILSGALYIASGLRLVISESVYSPLFRYFSDCSKD